jgi:hypothetical protein
MNNPLILWKVYNRKAWLGMSTKSSPCSNPEKQILSACVLVWMDAILLPSKKWVGQIGITRERVRQLQEQALRDLRNKMAKYEKQRTLEEVKVENNRLKKLNFLKDLLHKDISGLTNHPFPINLG